jgi:hypothetical protein
MKILMIFRFIPFYLAHKRLLYLNDNAILATLSHNITEMNKQLILELHYKADGDILAVLTNPFY